MRRRRLSLRAVLNLLVEDLTWLRHDLLLNTIGGSVLTPRLLRALIYRAGGVQTETFGIFSGCTIVGQGPLRLGNSSFVNRGCYFEAVAPITIGEQTAIGMEVMFVTSAHPLDAYGRFSHQAEPKAIVVGNRCWIGARALILPGVSVADGVIVAAGAVVARDCSPNGLYAGVPARRIRDLGVGAAAETGAVAEKEQGPRQTAAKDQTTL